MLTICEAGQITWATMNRFGKYWPKNDRCRRSYRVSSPEIFIERLDHPLQTDFDATDFVDSSPKKWIFLFLKRRAGWCHTNQWNVRAGRRKVWWWCDSKRPFPCWNNGVPSRTREGDKALAAIDSDSARGPFCVWLTDSVLKLALHFLHQMRRLGAAEAVAERAEDLPDFRPFFLFVERAQHRQTASSAPAAAPTRNRSASCHRN